MDRDDNNSGYAVTCLEETKELLVFPAAFITTFEICQHKYEQVGLIDQQPGAA